MPENPFKKEIPDSVRALSDAAEGLTDREKTSSEFLAIASGLAGRLSYLMGAAASGEERGMLMAAFSAHFMQVANMPFDRSDSIPSLDAKAQAVRRLGDAFMEAARRPDTVPEFFTSGQLRYVAGALKSAGDVRGQMTVFMRGEDGIRAMEGLAAAFHEAAASITALAGSHAPPPEEETPRVSPETRRRNRGGRPRFF